MELIEYLFCLLTLDDVLMIMRHDKTRPFSLVFCIDAIL